MSGLAVIIPAAGTSTRFGGGRNKLFEDLCGRPVLVRTLAAFLGRTDVTKVVIATSDEEGIRGVLGEVNPKIVFVAGGACRAESVRNALAAVGPEVEWVAVHDGARPLVSQGVIDRTMAAAREHGAAAPAVGMACTMKEVRGPLPARVERTIPRETVFAMQTPQIMRRADLARAFETCPMPLEQVTDDVQLLELAGLPVWLVEGEDRNLKITTLFDLAVAGASLHLT